MTVSRKQELTVAAGEGVLLVVVLVLVVTANRAGNNDSLQS
jgi:hypothetical protein